MVSFEKSKKKLTVVWLVFSGLLMVLLFIQSLGNKHGADIAEIWKWLLAATLPTLSLMIGAFAASINSKQEDKQIAPFVYKLAMGLSVFYLSIIAVLFLAQPQTNKTLLELSQQSAVYMTAFQGLVAAMIGAFFMKK